MNAEFEDNFPACKLHNFISGVSGVLFGYLVT